jgi:plasmid stabilization system protein ParE
LSLDVRLSPAAINDRQRLAEFLAEKNTSAALRAVETIVLALGTLADFPDQGRAIGEGRRELIIPLAIAATSRNTVWMPGT